MQTETQPVPKRPEAPAPSYFELQATWGVTKHFGGAQSTDELAALCHIDRGASVLDVGCGTGMSPCYLAQTIGCHIVGVDISERMIAWSRQRARRARLDERVSFAVADTQSLPFDDHTFDAVIAWKTFGSLLVTSASFRRYLRGLWPPRSALHMFDYLGNVPIERLGAIPQCFGELIAAGHEFGQEHQLRAALDGHLDKVCCALQVRVNTPNLAVHLHGCEDDMSRCHFASSFLARETHSHRAKSGQTSRP